MSNPTEAHGGFTPNESLNTSTYLLRLLPTTIDAIAQSDPDRVFAEFLEAPHYSGETYELTFGVFARIIDRLSWWMSEICSQIGLKHFDTIAFAGFLDLRHYGMLVAAIKCGYKILFCTLVNDASAMARLFQDADAKVFFITEEESPNVPKIYSLPTILIPSVERLIGVGKVPSFPYTKTFADAAQDPIIVFHTSGTTGFPKARVWTNAHVAVMDEGQSIPPFRGKEVSEHHNPVCHAQKRSRRFCGLRCCYTSMIAGIGAAVFLDVVVVFLPFHVSEYSGDRAASWLQKAGCDDAIVFPSFLSLIEDSQALLEQLTRLRKIFWIGAPLSWDVARLLIDRTHLATLWGTTESGYLVSFETDPEDWNYLNINAEKDGIKWVEKAPNRFEMQFIKRNEAIDIQPVFLTLPDADIFSSGDLFSQHPNKPDHWKYEGRPDNIIVVKDMLFDPSAIEKNIESHVSVKTAIVLGINYSVVCLILELQETPQISFEEIWNTIGKTCEGMPDHQVIKPSRVILVQAEKPVPRNHKGEVKRLALAELYSAEMNSCYT